MNKESILKYIKVATVVASVFGVNIDLTPEQQKTLIEAFALIYALIIGLEGKLKNKIKG